MNGNAIEVSVIIPAYNAAATLGEQLEALARQHVGFSWEVIVSDNGSTDATASVARAWDDRLPLAVVDASARRGASTARNLGAVHAQGKFFAFIDADDVVADDWLEKMHAAFQQHDFIGGGGRRRYVHTPANAGVYYIWATYSPPYFPQLPITGSCHMGIAAELFRKVGGFDEALIAGEDDDLCWRVQLGGCGLVGHPEAVVNVRGRESLAALVRQQFNWGVGERQLRHKYARVIAAYQEQFPMTLEMPSGGTLIPRDPPIALLKRVARKFASVRKASDLTKLASVVAYRVGSRFGRIDLTMPQVEPPVQLPPPLVSIS
jgi:glycosyltransferase involved in cell wall biosynthesis